MRHTDTHELLLCHYLMSRQVFNNNETFGTITNVAGDYIVHGEDQILGQWII